MMKNHRHLVLASVFFVLAFLTGCNVSGPPPVVISGFSAAPAEGAAPLNVEFSWAIDDRIRDYRCTLWIVPPQSDQPEPVHLDTCKQARVAKDFSDVGLYQAVLVVHSTDAENAQAIFDDPAGNGVDAEWLENRARTRSLTFEVTAASANTAPPASEPQDAMSEWVLVETDTNPYDLSVEGDLFVENASYAGSFHECTVEAGTITYWHYVKTQVSDLANIICAYEFDVPPSSVQAGETISLSHVLSVSGEVKVGGGYTPSCRAAYSTNIHDPDGLSVSSASLNDDRYSTSEADVIEIRFPTDGNWFGIEARVLDAQNPDIACDIAWWYERYDETQD